HPAGDERRPVLPADDQPAGDHRGSEQRELGGRGLGEQPVQRVDAGPDDQADEVEQAAQRLPHPVDRGLEGVSHRQAGDADGQRVHLLPPSSAAAGSSTAAPSPSPRSPAPSAAGPLPAPAASPAAPSPFSSGPASAASRVPRGITPTRRSSPSTTASGNALSAAWANRSATAVSGVTRSISVSISPESSLAFSRTALPTALSLIPPTR